MKLDGTRFVSFEREFLSITLAAYFPLCIDYSPTGGVAVQAMRYKPGGCGFDFLLT